MIESTAIKGILEDAFSIGKQCSTPKEIAPGLVVHHQDMNCTDLTVKLRENDRANNPGPKNPSGKIHCHRQEDFGRVFQNYQDERSTIFADPEKFTFLAIFDHFSPNADKEKGDTPKDEGQPSKTDRKLGWRQFIATLILKKSRKLKAWEGLNAATPQPTFADFIEEHLDDIATPDGQTVLQIATDLETNSSGSFKSKLNLDNGSVQLNFQDEATATVEVPKEITLAIPLFEGGERYKIAARLRFQVREGLLTFRVLLSNLEDAIDQEFERLVQEIEEAVALPIIRGSAAYEL